MKLNYNWNIFTQIIDFIPKSRQIFITFESKFAKFSKFDKKFKTSKVN